jgi:hypothetical protein
LTALPPIDLTEAALRPVGAGGSSAVERYGGA